MPRALLKLSPLIILAAVTLVAVFPGRAFAETCQNGTTFTSQDLATIGGITAEQFCADKGGLNVTATAVSGACQPGGSFLGFPTWYKYLKGKPVTDLESNTTRCSPQLTETSGQIDLSDIWLIVLAVLELLIQVAGILAVFMVVYGGIKYTMSQGQPDATKAARSTITNALIGMVISVVAIGLVRFVAGSMK